MESRSESVLEQPFWPVSTGPAPRQTGFDCIGGKSLLLTSWDILGSLPWVSSPCQMAVILTSQGELCSRALVGRPPQEPLGQEKATQDKANEGDFFETGNLDSTGSCS